MSNERKDLTKNVIWTHYFEPPMIPGYAEKSIILSERSGLVGTLCGDTRILTDSGYVGWESKKDLSQLPTNP